MIKRMKQKGFTLIELLVTVVLLGIVGGIIIYNVTGLASGSKDSEYEKFTAAVKSAATAYADVHKEVVEQLYVDKAFVYLKTSDLIENGFLSENTKNPHTGEKIGFNEKIRASLDQTTGAVIFDYPIIETEQKETFMVALADYVVYGEPYNCLEGVGTYEFALSEEDGTLITKDKLPEGYAKDTSGLMKYYEDKFGFQCEVPKGFEDALKNDGETFRGFVDANIKNGFFESTFNANSVIQEMKSNGGQYYFPMENGKFITGTFEIKYTWISETGIKKQHTRTLKVLPQAKAILKFNDEYNTEMQKHYTKNKIDGAMYTQELKYDKNHYIPLSYKVGIEGAPTAKFNVSTSRCDNSNSCSTNYTVKDGNQDEYYVVDDGNKIYDFSYKVNGHHLVNYVYSGSTSYALGTTYVPRTEFLKIYNSNEAGENTHVSPKGEKTSNKPNYIEDSKELNGFWSIKRFIDINTNVVNGITFIDNEKIADKNIKDNTIYAPSKISKIVLVNATAGDVTSQSDPNYVDFTNQTNTNGIYSLVLDLNHKTAPEKWRYVRYAVVNDNGFISELSNPIPIYVSNYLNDLLSSHCDETTCDRIKQPDTSKSTKSCKKAFNGQTYDYVENRALSYRNVDRDYGYIKFDGWTGNQTGFIAALSTTEGGNTRVVDAKELSSMLKFSVNTVHDNVTWGVHTCNGYFTASYTQVTQDAKNVIDEATNRCNLYGALTDGNKHLCPISDNGLSYIGTVSYNKASELGIVVANDVKGGTTNICLWDTNKYTKELYSKTKHGEKKYYNNTYIYTYKFDISSKTVVQIANETENSCGTRCYIDLIPDTYVKEGLGTRANKFVVSVPDYK